MKRYRYVIVRSNGDSFPIKSEVATDVSERALPQFLKDGWVPVRESPMSAGAEYGYSLVLLARDDDVLGAPARLASASDEAEGGQSDDATDAYSLTPPTESTLLRDLPKLPGRRGQKPDSD